MKQLVLTALVLLLSSSMAIAQDFCFGDFFYDGDVDGVDMSTFLEQFGRGQYSNPCPLDGPMPVQKTGQTMSYTPSDDGDLLRGGEWPVPRFLDNSDGTVTDNLTGLIWLKDANCFGQRNWYEAITDCHNLGAPDCDLADGSSPGDWRLPNLFELESLRNMKFFGPSLSNTAGTGQWKVGDPFIKILTGGTDGYYWSSTTYANGTYNAWNVFMYDGAVYSYDKWNIYYVWPVRGGR